MPPMVAGGHEHVDPRHLLRLDEHHPATAAAPRDVDAGAVARREIDRGHVLARAEHHGRTARRQHPDLGTRDSGVVTGRPRVDRVQLAGAAGKPADGNGHEASVSGAK
ncbi:MAG: hypothetical protein WKF58_12675 [Ilumatobacteraceae bacterium]